MSYGKEVIHLNSCQLVVFSLGAEEYAIPISYAERIVRIPALKKIPNTPEFIEGVFALRGKIIPAVDLKKRFGFGKFERGNDSRLLILDFEGTKLGIIVDDVTEVLKIDEQAIQHLDDEICQISKNSIKGVSILDERIIMILDMSNLKSEIFKVDFEKELVS